MKLQTTISQEVNRFGLWILPSYVEKLGL